MPYADNNGVKIYYEVEGEGPPLVLAHQLIESMKIWRRRGYEDALKDDYQLILFDSRGRGQSDKPSEASAYDIRLMAGDAVAVLDDLGIAKTHYFGFSSGARIGFWLATHHADRFLSFILGGQTPYHYAEVAIRTVPEVIETYKLRLIDQEAALQRRQGWLRWFGVDRPLTDQEKSAFLAEDAQTLAALYTAYLNWPALTDQGLAGISLPCLVICGGLDEGGHYQGAKDCVNHIPNAKFVPFPDLGHITAFSRIDLVLPYIKEFLAGVGKTQSGK